MAWKNEGLWACFKNGYPEAELGEGIHYLEAPFRVFCCVGEVLLGEEEGRELHRRGKLGGKKEGCPEEVGCQIRAHFREREMGRVELKGWVYKPE